MQATKTSSSFEVTTDGVGVVGHAGAALLRELADRVGLTWALGWQRPGGRRRHPEASVLRDLAVVLADGGDCLSGLAVLRDQPELFGPVASTPTAWRVVEGVAIDPDGLARLRAARAHARARAWTAGANPDVEVLIIDADATLVLSHSDAKQGAAGTYKHTFGFHPLLAYLARGQARRVNPWWAVKAVGEGVKVAEPGRHAGHHAAVRADRLDLVQRARHDLRQGRKSSATRRSVRAVS